jgi:uncharacterized protein (DUF58 family)
MTLRAAVLAVGGAALVACGWYTGWPEFTALGAAAVALIVLVVIVAGPPPRVQVALDQAAMRVVRGQQATAQMTLHLSRRWRWLRIIEGPLAAPIATSPLKKPEGGGVITLRLPVNTSTRGERRIGPYAVVHGDPWSIVRRVTARAEGGLLTVHPRTVPVRRSALPALQQHDSDFASRWRGDEHFYALRDYVLGDEPSKVHWRSSARAGRLVVKQHVAAAPSGTAIVLDTDASAYGSDEQFGSGWVPERFEAAVEVAASFAVAQTVRADQIHVVTTSRGAFVTSASGDTTQSLLDAFAAVCAMSPLDIAPEETAALVRRLRCTRLIVVTGTPSRRLLQAARTMAVGQSSATVVRVGSRHREALSGLHMLDVERVDDLAAAG